MREDLPNCPECGKGRLHPLTRTEEFDFDLGDEKVKVRVENVPVEKCDKCGEVISGPAASKLRDEAICRAAGLLTPAEIKAIRENFGWSQQHLAELTGFGVATVSRWERGRLMQNRSNNKVLLALRDCSPFREFLQGLHSRTAPEVGRQEVDKPLSAAILQQMIDEQIRPLREQVRRLENEVHTGGAGDS